MYEGPGRYRHHRGDLYRVHGVARRKATGERVVVYETLNIAQSSIGDDDFWMHSLAEFNQVIDGTPRFAKLS